MQKAAETELLSKFPYGGMYSVLNIAPEVQIKYRLLLIF